MKHVIIVGFGLAGRCVADLLTHAKIRFTIVERNPVTVATQRALGRDTDSALRAGVGVGFEGAARWLVERIASEACLGEAPVVLTGGARAFLAEALVLPGRRLLVEPDLVARGLAAAAGWWA